MRKNQFVLLLKYEKEVTGLLLFARSVVQYFIFQYDQLIFFILDL